jgi:hypothetical protein
VKRKHISLNLVVVDDQDKSSLIANVNVGWIWGCISLLCNLRTYDDYLFWLRELFYLTLGIYNWRSPARLGKVLAVENVPIFRLKESSVFVTQAESHGEAPDHTSPD